MEDMMNGWCHHSIRVIRDRITGWLLPSLGHATTRQNNLKCMQNYQMYVRKLVLIHVVASPVCLFCILHARVDNVHEEIVR